MSALEQARKLMKRYRQPLTRIGDVVKADFKTGKGLVYHGNNLDILEQMPANSVHSVITDPPYALEFMGKNWDRVLPSLETWKQCLRVAKPGAFLLCFGGTRTYHRLACHIEDAGWEIRDCMMWIYGSGFPKSHNISKGIDRAAGAERDIVGISTNQVGVGWVESDQAGYGSEFDITEPATKEAKLWDGWGTALKPAYEPILIAMKPIEGTFAENALKHGVAGLNIDGSRVGTDTRVMPWMSEKSVDAFNRDDNWKPQDGSTVAIGRWPANIVHDGSDEVVEKFPSPHGAGNIRDGGQSEQDQEGGLFGVGQHEGNGIRFGDSGSAARFFYTAKASKAERGEENNHPTVKPLALMEYLCTLTKTPEDGVVLDPFFGSGTTGVACQNTGRLFIGIELERDSFDIACRRLK